MSGNDELRRLAEAAMPAMEHPCAGSCLGCGAGPDEACFDPCRCDEGNDCDAATIAINAQRKPHRAFTLAASPARILELLDALEAAQAERDELRAALEWNR